MTDKNAVASRGRSARPRLATPFVVAVVAAVACSPSVARAQVPVPDGAGPVEVVRSVAPFVAGAPPGASAAQRSPGRWRWPLEPRPELLRRYERPGSAWGPGHRGLDLGGLRGQVVHAVEGGVVSHVGAVAGRGTVSVLHRDGLRSTYEPVDPVVRLGQVVDAGEVLGGLAVAGSHCPVAAPTCLHVGALRGPDYLDPEPLLVRARIILLPLR